MDIRILRYFLTVAKEQNFTRAAEQLNITQPTLSRQLAALEEELGTALFIRGSRSITLTEAGILLKRRALEIIDLEEKMLDELKVREELIEGTITIGCGEFAAVETLAEICKTYKQKYPMVQIALHTATADSVYEMMNQGLVDIGLFLEPVNTEGLDYIRIVESDHWDVPYHVIHRIAAIEPGHKAAEALFNWAFTQSRCIRIDTHKDNVIMHHILTRYGFTHCGTIYLANGDPREAYQK